MNHLPVHQSSVAHDVSGRFGDIVFYNTAVGRSHPLPLKLPNDPFHKIHQGINTAINRSSQRRADIYDVFISAERSTPMATIRSLGPKHHNSIVRNIWKFIKGDV